MCYREKLQKALHQYIRDTFRHIDTVRGFCEGLSKWTAARKTEWTKMTKITKQQQKRELGAVLKETLGGLKKLEFFLDALENLAVTSSHVFASESRVLRLPEGIRPKDVQLAIFAARMICPRLLGFKRDASVFFLPKLQNVEVLSYQLNEYMKTTQDICGTLEKSSFGDSSLKTDGRALVDLRVALSEDTEEEVQRMLCHIDQLTEIRMNQHFRMVFLFQGVPCSDFIREFRRRGPGLRRTLKDVEQSAVTLDRMNKGAKISSVVGSSVGVTGGLLSIAGLALIPFTAGVSLGLMIGGTSLGITSGVTSVATTITEIVVNRISLSEANESFQSFMEAVQSIQDCLEVASTQPAVDIQWKPDYLKLLQLKTVASVVFQTKSLLTDISDIAPVRRANALRNISGATLEVQDVGQTAVKGSLALSKKAIQKAIGLNVLFIGMDVVCICRSGISLANGSETEESQFIRARARLWGSQVDSWQQIHDFLDKGLPTWEEDKAALVTQFYPEKK
ncbi:Apolipoprotein L3 [Liparis tanakae]|uniref:Apolipoprotein L3 n=1 Tax=Liparis tanakae TaxID=230148 RepID=A0A4Z2FQA7_9TELE|nr:Apolipoprotein L3 [Liparis tanakae]